MVARILSGKSMRGLLKYNENKVCEGNAELMMASGFAIPVNMLNIQQKLERFERLTKRNGKVKTNAVHIMLNFTQGDKLDSQKLLKIAERYMEQIGFADQPFLVYRHLDAHHPHLHLVTTNMKADGKRIDLHNIGKTLSEPARKNIEKEFNLIRAEGKEQDRLIKPVLFKAEYGKSETKRAIYNIVTSVMRSYAFGTFAEFNAVLKQFNVVADRGKPDSMMYEKRGLIYSITDAKGNKTGIPFKASALAGKPTLNAVEKKFERNALVKKLHREHLKTAVAYALNTCVNQGIEQWMDALRSKGIAVVFSQNEQGRIYGLTFIDHRKKTVFKGSELGKAYSANAILERLTIKPAVELRESQLQPSPQLTNSSTNQLPNSSPNQLTNSSSHQLPNPLDTLLQPASYQEAIGPVGKRKRKKKKITQQERSL